MMIMMAIAMKMYKFINVYDSNGENDDGNDDEGKGNNSDGNDDDNDGNGVI